MSTNEYYPTLVIYPKGDFFCVEEVLSVSEQGRAFERVRRTDRSALTHLQKCMVFQIPLEFIRKNVRSIKRKVD